MTPKPDPDQPLSRPWIQRALGPDAGPEVVRPFVRALAPIVHREVAARVAPAEVAQVLEAVFQAWCSEPRAVLLARRPRHLTCEAWFARCAQSYVEGAHGADFSGEVVTPVAHFLKAGDAQAAATRFRAELSPWERAVFDLVYVERRADPAAAAELGVDPSVVAQARGRLRARIRRFRRGAAS